MKNFIRIFWMLLVLPFCSPAQPTATKGKDITGLWQGYVNTVEKKLPYELVIAEKDGELMAYSLTSFTINNQEIISVKKMKIAFDKEGIIISDDDMLFNNFTSEAAKKIKQTNTLLLGTEGLRITLTGKFETKTNRALRPASGDVYLIKKEDPAEIKLMAKLEEMKLADGLSFFQKKQLQVTAAPALVSATPVPQAMVPTEEAIEAEQKVLVSVKRLPLREEQRIIYTRQKSNTYKVTTVKHPSTSAFAAIQNLIPAKTIVTKQPVIVQPTVVAKNATPSTVAKTAAATVAKAPAVVAKSTAVIKPAPKNIEVAPAIDLAKRKIETIDQLFIASDSLVLTLYDNGDVDGDSVSIILNGKTIVSQQLLSTTAFTKTIYITPELGDTIQLVMYAENLGSLPPNTGLLLLQFDNKRHEIRFSGDLNKNAAITLRRKEKH